MIDTGFEAALRNREIDSRVVHHPFRIVWLQHCRRLSENRRVKPNTGIEIVHRYVHVKSFHDRLLFSLSFLGFDLDGGQQRPRAVSTTVRHSYGIRWQQFCVRYVMSSATRSKSTA